MIPVEDREEGRAGAAPLPAGGEARCGESQADGVPCASVVTACAECPRAEPIAAPTVAPGAARRPRP